MKMKSSKSLALVALSLQIVSAVLTLVNIIIVAGSVWKFYSEVIAAFVVNFLLFISITILAIWTVVRYHRENDSFKHHGVVQVIFTIVIVAFFIPSSHLMFALFLQRDSVLPIFTTILTDILISAMLIFDAWLLGKSKVSVAVQMENFVDSGDYRECRHKVDSVITYRNTEVHDQSLTPSRKGKPIASEDELQRAKRNLKRSTTSNKSRHESVNTLDSVFRGFEIPDVSIELSPRSREDKDQNEDITTVSCRKDLSKDIEEKSSDLLSTAKKSCLRRQKTIEISTSPSTSASSYEHSLVKDRDESTSTRTGSDEIVPAGGLEVSMLQEGMTPFPPMSSAKILVPGEALSEKVVRFESDNPASVTSNIKKRLKFSVLSDQSPAEKAITIT